MVKTQTKLEAVDVMRGGEPGCILKGGPRGIATGLDVGVREASRMASCSGRAAKKVSEEVTCKLVLEVGVGCVVSPAGTVCHLPTLVALAACLGPVVGPH